MNYRDTMDILIQFELHVASQYLNIQLIFYL